MFETTARKVQEEGVIAYSWRQAILASLGGFVFLLLSGRDPTFSAFLQFLAYVWVISMTFNYALVTLYRRRRAGA